MYECLNVCAVCMYVMIARYRDNASSPYPVTRASLCPLNHPRGHKLASVTGEGDVVLPRYRAINIYNKRKTKERERARA